ncbi:MAG TPA: DUF2510 domain-containing protein, partial [Cellulomonas sp.]|nr:DUF2510 domain-containing protein [Cellulomonas sp.]
MNAAAPGWYPDPEHPAMARWWNGATWTENRAPATPPRKPRNTTATVLIVVGAVIGAFVLVGVLAAVAIPVFLNQQHKSDLSALRALTCDDVG